MLQDVRLRFGPHEVLRGITTSLELSQRTAIIGSVGGGKSTLLELLLGEVPLTSGSIEVQFDDGSCGPLWRRDVYTVFRSSVAYAPQQPFLSNTSMRDNIDLSGQAQSEDLETAVSLAQLNDDIALFKRGLLEEIGESGINLSGGQKQRVSLARAFISKRPIWVLDDPLSAVDSVTEQRLTQAICAHSRGLILVSHRVSVLESCDRVLVLEDGRVIEDGDPEVLSHDPSSHVYRFLQAVTIHGK
jgi:ABC-type bacteriocin/lantibiotic exporter with double-glycine peptidase domain